MLVWWLVFFCNLLLPIIMIIAGRMMWKHCPKEINVIYGYRTKRSMINQETWKFANEYCGKLWWILGIIMLIASGLIHFLFINSSDRTIGTVGLIPSILQCVIMVMSIIPTELALKKQFTSEGIRK